MDYRYNFNSIEDAIKNQNEIKKGIKHEFIDIKSIEYALSIGVSYNEKTSTAVCVAIVCYSDCIPVDENYFIVKEHVDFPYVSGLFAYREGPAVSKLLDSISRKPDMIFFDSQGIAHPRGLGLAAHIGILHDIPTVGVTRRKLFGRTTVCPNEAGAMCDIVDFKSERIGIQYRPLVDCSPIFSSFGHRTDYETLRAWLHSLKNFRSCFPTSIDLAHKYANMQARNL
jgi:deoxyribonuclease V